MTEHSPAPVRSAGGGRSRITLRPLDQFVFGFGMFVSMLAIVVGSVMLVDSRGRFPYVAIGGVMIGAASLWYLRRRYRHERTVRGLPATPPHESVLSNAETATSDPDITQPPDNLDG